MGPPGSDLEQPMQRVTLPTRAGAGARSSDNPPERLIVATKRRLRARDLLDDISVIRVLSARDFKVKYKQSLLGPLWLVFQPLALLAAFLVAFRGLADVETSGIPYAVFALVGLAAWAFFQASMTIGAASIITNLAYVRFTPCPRAAFPLAAIIASLPSFAVTAAGAIVAAAVTGHLSPKVLLLPAGLVWLMLLTAGIVGIAASLAVRYRDIISALPFLLQVGLFLAPIGYSMAGLPDAVRVIVDLNPLTGLIEAWRWMLLSGYEPSFAPIGISLVATPLLVVSGWLIFSRLETTMADEI
jgi:lipopolysaccharide transport system permease protein